MSGKVGRMSHRHRTRSSPHAPSAWPPPLLGRPDLSPLRRPPRLAGPVSRTSRGELGRPASVNALVEVSGRLGSRIKIVIVRAPCPASPLGTPAWPTRRGRTVCLPWGVLPRERCRGSVAARGGSLLARGDSPTPHGQRARREGTGAGDPRMRPQRPRAEPSERASPL